MPAKKKCILIVDDDAAIRLAFSTVLRDAGFQVETAQDGSEALKMTMRQPFDLIVLDIFMPHMNGLDCIRALKISQPRVPFIVVTANEQSSLAREAFNFGAKALVGKPVSNVEFTHTIRDVLGLAEPDRTA